MLLAAAVVAGTVVGPALSGLAGDTAAARSRAADESEATPLAVQMTGMTPAVIPRKGPLLLRGIVTNVSPEEWTDINVAPFLSSEPMTTRDELASAAATDVAATVGTRLSDPSTYVNVGDLLPGQSTTFAIKVPRDSMGITGDPGVYWVGVHALGSSAAGRDLVADGRARSFIPLVTKKQARRSVDVSLVLPMRERARRAADGSLSGPARWVALTGPRGAVDPARRVRRVRRVEPGHLGDRPGRARRPRGLQPRQPAPVARARPAHGTHELALARQLEQPVGEPVADGDPEGGRVDHLPGRHRRQARQRGAGRRRDGAADRSWARSAPRHC